MKNKEIRERIKMIISDLGGKKNKLSEKLGIDSVNVSRWINKGFIPNGEILQKFHNKLNINIDWLLTGEGDQYISASEKAPPTNYTILNDDEKKLLGEFRSLPTSIKRHYTALMKFENIKESSLPLTHDVMEKMKENKIRGHPPENSKPHKNMFRKTG